MYKLKEIADKIYYVGVNDRQKALFENMWPLPYGVSYNSYLIVDEKTVEAIWTYTERLGDEMAVAAAKMYCSANKTAFKTAKGKDKRVVYASRVVPFLLKSGLLV